MNLQPLLDAIPEDCEGAALYLKGADGTSFTKWWGDYEAILGGLVRLSYEINRDVDKDDPSVDDDEPSYGHYL